MKRVTFSLVATLAICAVVTACGDDSDGGSSFIGDGNGDGNGDGGGDTISCTIPEMEVCFTGEGTSGECTDTGGEVIGSCPGDAVKTCEVDNDGSNATMYLYGAMVESMTCEQLAASFGLEVADDGNNDDGNDDNTNNNTGGDTISCDMPDYGICMTGTNDGESCESAGAVSISSCPTNGATECDIDIDGEAVTIFIYEDSMLAGSSCADLQSMM